MRLSPLSCLLQWGKNCQELNMLDVSAEVPPQTPLIPGVRKDQSISRGPGPTSLPCSYCDPQVWSCKARCGSRATSQPVSDFPSAPKKEGTPSLLRPDNSPAHCCRQRVSMSHPALTVPSSAAPASSPPRSLAVTSVCCPPPPALAPFPPTHRMDSQGLNPPPWAWALPSSSGLDIFFVPLGL